jgi:hypothetical protein
MALSSLAEPIWRIIVTITTLKMEGPIRLDAVWTDIVDLGKSRSAYPMHNETPANTDLFMSRWRLPDHVADGLDDRCGQLRRYENRRDAVTVTVLIDLHELVFGPGFRGYSRYRGDLIPVFR